MNRINNKEDITVIWCDSKIGSNDYVEQIKKQLRQINDFIVFHTQVESCISFIQSIHNEIVFFISSIYDAPQILPHIVTLSQIDSIFVFNWEKVDNEHFVLEHSKFIGIYDELDLLCLSIQEQVDLLDRDLQIFSFFDQNERLTKDLSKQTADLLWFQLYHDVLFQLTYDEDAKQEMIDACRSYYRDNIKELEVLKKFENEYRSEEALQCASNEGQLIKEKYIEDSHRQMEDLSIKILFGRLMCDMGQWNQSQHFFQHLLNNSNTNNEDLVKIEYSLGEVLQWKGEWNEARKYYDRAYERMTNIKSTQIKDSANILFNIGEILYLEGKYEEAQNYYERALAIRKQNIGYIQKKRGKYDEALDFHQRALALQEKYYPSYYAKIANTLNLISDLLLYQSKYNEALCYCQRALTMQKSYYPSGSVSMAFSLSSMANILHKQEKYNEAVNLDRRALATIEKHNPSDRSSIVSYMNNIGVTLRKQEKYDEALDYHRRALEMQEKYYPSCQHEIANTLNYIGNLLIRQKKFNEALKFYECALEVQEKYYSNGHVDIATTLNNIGTTFHRQENFDKAIEYHQKALEIQEKYYPSGSVFIADTINHIGHVLYDEEKCLLIKETSLPSQDLSITNILDWLSQTVIYDTLSKKKTFMRQQLLLCWASVLALMVLPSESVLSSGCGKPLPSDFSAGQTTSIRVPAANGQPVRHYKVHLSANFQNNRGHAIVFSFHGHNGDMDKQEDLSQLSQKGLLISGAGIIAVYPKGKLGTDGQTAWQGAPYSAPGVDDIAFVNTMIFTLQSIFCVDSSRIYATGKSNGAGFVNLLACTPWIAAKFAAFATVSAAFYTTTFNGDCPTQRAIPILDFHGTADSVAAYNGGQAHGAPQVSINSFRQGWASRNGCQGNATISHLSKGTDPQQLVEIQTWNTNCKAGGIVIGYKITEGQHGWPRTTLPAKNINQKTQQGGSIIDHILVI
ncbi:unnamed protein product [Rotaria sordida]|uniref:Feruloyl esterase n=1 Tax=Rotaria sordida TaxID=392033 RepID=A0A814DV10_9BILA|nr:unnamed protein product [Rotaria sordida]